MSDNGKATPGVQTDELEIIGPTNRRPPTPQASRLSRLNKRAFTIAGLFLFGMLCICVIRIIGQPQLAEGQSTIDRSADGVIGMLSSGASPWLADSKAREVMDTLLNRPSNAQASALSPRGNPFVFEPAVQTQATQPREAPEADPKAKELERMTAVAEGLQLESILLSDEGPTAVVSGKLVKEGQVVEGWTVREIHPKNVVLIWEGHSFALAIR
jgi:hypothetical protein